MTAEKTYAYFVSMGVRLGADDKPFLLANRIEGPTSTELSEANSVFAFNNKVRHLQCGQVYKIEVTNEGASILPKSAGWCGQFKDADKVVEWSAISEANELRLRSKSKEKKLGDSFALKGRIQPLRDVYQALAPTERLPFELWLLNELRKRK